MLREHKKHTLVDGLINGYRIPFSQTITDFLTRYFSGEQDVKTGFPSFSLFGYSNATTAYYNDMTAHVRHIFRLNPLDAWGYSKGITIWFPEELQYIPGLMAQFTSGYNSVPKLTFPAGLELTPTQQKQLTDILPLIRDAIELYDMETGKVINTYKNVQEFATAIGIRLPYTPISASQLKDSQAIFNDEVTVVQLNDVKNGIIISSIEDMVTLTERVKKYNLHHLKISLSFALLEEIINNEETSARLQSILPQISSIRLSDASIEIPRLATVYTKFKNFPPVNPAEASGSESHIPDIKIANGGLFIITPETTDEHLDEISSLNGSVTVEIKDKTACTGESEFHPRATTIKFSSSLDSTLKIKLHYIEAIQKKISKQNALTGLILDNVTIIGPNTVSQFLSAVLHPNLERIVITGCDLNRSGGDQVVETLVNYIKNQARKLRSLQLFNHKFSHAQQERIIDALVKYTAIMEVKGVSSPGLNTHIANNEHKERVSVQMEKQRIESEAAARRILEDNKAKKIKNGAVLKQLEEIYHSGGILESDVPENLSDISKSLDSAISYAKPFIRNIADAQLHYWLSDVAAEAVHLELPTLLQYRQLISNINSIRMDNKETHVFTANSSADLKYIYKIIRKHNVQYIEKLSITFPLKSAEKAILSKLIIYVDMIVFRDTIVDDEQVSALKQVKKEAKSFGLRSVDYTRTVVSAKNYIEIQQLFDVAPKKNVRLDAYGVTTITAQGNESFVIIGQVSPRVIKDFRAIFPEQTKRIQLDESGLLPEAMALDSMIIEINDVYTFNQFYNIPLAVCGEPKCVEELNVKFNPYSLAVSPEALENLLAHYHAKKLVLHFPASDKMGAVLAKHMRSNRYLTVLDTGTYFSGYSTIALTNAVLHCPSLTSYTRFEKDEAIHTHLISGQFKAKSPSDVYIDMSALINSILSARNIDDIATTVKCEQKIIDILNSYEDLTKVIIAPANLDTVLTQYTNIANKVLRRWLELFCKAGDVNLAKLVKDLFSAILSGSKGNAFFIDTNALKQHIVNILNTDESVRRFLVAHIKGNAIDKLIELVELAGALKASAYKPVNLISSLDLSPFVDTLIHAIGEYLAKEVMRLGRDCVPGMVESELRKTQADNELEIINPEANKKDIDKVGHALREKSIAQFNTLIDKLQTLSKKSDEGTRTLFIRLISTINQNRQSWMHHAQMFNEAIATFTNLTKKTSINGNVLNANIRYQLNQLLALDSKELLELSEFNEALAKVSNISQILGTYPDKEEENIEFLRFAIIMLFKQHGKLFNSKESNTLLASEEQLLKLLTQWVVAEQLEPSIQAVILAMLQAKLYRLILQADKFTSIVDIQTAAANYQGPVVDESGKGKGKLRITKEEKYYPLAQAAQQANSLNDLPEIIDAYLAKSSSLGLERGFINGLKNVKQQITNVLKSIAINTTPSESTEFTSTPGETPGNPSLTETPGGNTFVTAGEPVQQMVDYAAQIPSPSDSSPEAVDLSKGLYPNLNLGEPQSSAEPPQTAPPQEAPPQEAPPQGRGLGFGFAAEGEPSAPSIPPALSPDTPYALRINSVIPTAM